MSKIEIIRLKQIEKQLGTLAAIEELQKFKSGFAYGNSPIVIAKGANDIEIVSAHWEFIPEWITTLQQLEAARKEGIPWLNARSETILSSRMFSEAARERRCLVIASHFFEWRHYKPEGQKKDIAYPYLVEVAGVDYFYMAGIYNSYQNPRTGKILTSFAIITTAANSLMNVVHNKKQRMPTILPDELAYEWIQDGLSDKRIKELATYQLPSELMNAYTIAKDFKTANDPCLKYDYEELPELDIAL